MRRNALQQQRRHVGKLHRRVWQLDKHSRCHLQSCINIVEDSNPIPFRCLTKAATCNIT